MLVFSNHGEIDPRLITTLGTNVKLNASPIGEFGTGLKYTLAILLRKGFAFTVCSGRRKFEFETEEEEIRGKTFQMINMVENDLLSGKPQVTRLGFTTELGAKWQLWMAYRELRSNCQDEGGSIELLPDGTEVSCEPGMTKICVWGLDHWHQNAGQVFLDETPALWANTDIEIHEGLSSSLFYRGIRVKKLDKPSLYTYNILSTMTLTEDRTLEGMWYANYYLAGALMQCNDPAIRKAIIGAGRDSFESTLDFGSAAHSPTPAFMEEVGTAKIVHNDSITRAYAAHVETHFVPSLVVPDPTDQTRLDKACQSVRPHVDMMREVQFVDRLKPGEQSRIVKGNQTVFWLPIEALELSDDDLMVLTFTTAVCYSEDLALEDSPLAAHLAKRILGLL